MRENNVDIKPLKCQDPTKLFAGKHYISFDSLEKKLSTSGCLRSTLLCYLVQWKKQGKIFSAGRGWYSDLKQPLLLDTVVIDEYVSFLRNTFPLLEFKCWSTHQLMNFHQHLPLRYSTFIYVDRYSMTDVAEALREKMVDEAVFIHPPLKTGATLFCDGNKIVIRPLLYDDLQTPDIFYMPSEELLADYAIEAERLMLIDSTEFRTVFENILSTGRLNIPALLRRLAHRQIENPNIKTIHSILT